MKLTTKKYINILKEHSNFVNFIKKPKSGFRGLGGRLDYNRKDTIENRILNNPLLTGIIGPGRAEKVLKILKPRIKFDILEFNPFAYFNSALFFNDVESSNSLLSVCSVSFSDQSMYYGNDIDPLTFTLNCTHTNKNSWSFNRQYCFETFDKLS